MTQKLDPHVAVVPGSFDPMTLGHRNVIERAAHLYDRVIVGLLINPDKKYLFSEKERQEIAFLTLSGLGNVKITTDRGYLTDFCLKMGAKVIVKGVRTTEDFVYEQEMAEFNRKREPRLETVYLPAEPSWSTVSSTRVREALRSHLVLDGLLHPDVIDWCCQKGYLGK